MDNTSFQSTFEGLRACVYAMDEAYTLEDMELSTDESHAASRMYSFAKQYVEQFERLSHADNMENEGLDGNGKW